MKILIASDFHANIEAFNVLMDFIKNKRLKLIFLGDYVGYNADPEKVVINIQNLEKQGLLVAKIIGNHDQAVIDPIMCNRFNANARRAIIWTIKNTSENVKNWLINLSKMVKLKSKFLFCHGSLSNPNEYIFNEEIAYKNFLLFPKNIHCTFFGHTHIPVIYEFIKQKDILNTYWMDNEEEFKLKPDALYLINPGSVGQPRNGDNRLSFIIFDTKTNTINYYKKKYDYTKTQQKILKYHLPEFNALRLEEGC